jgi:uncharacterized protein YndB with AHSA1/START domain
MAAARSEPAEAGWTVLQVRRTFDAPRERVFEAWIDPELLRQWLTGWRGPGPHAEVDARVGGEFRITTTSRIAKVLGPMAGRTGYAHMIGRYVEIDPPQRLVFTLGWEDVPTIHMGREASTVTVEFNEKGEGTEVVLTHEKQPNRRIRAYHSIGWRASLRKLEELLAG